MSCKFTCPNCETYQYFHIFTVMKLDICCD